MLTAKIGAQVQDAYIRALNLGHRIRYVTDFLLARAWFTKQFSPPPYRLRPTDKHSHFMIPTERRNFQSPVSHVTTAQRVRGRNSDSYNDKMYDAFRVTNEETRTEDRDFHLTLAHDLTSTWKNTESSTNREDPKEFRLSLSIQHRIGI